MNRRTAWAVAFGAAVAVQCWALYTPSPPGDPTGLPLDKVVHLLLFGVVGLLGVLAGIPKRWLLLGLVAQAFVSEAVQARALADRGGDPWDLAADLVGAGLGVWLGTVVVRRWSAAEADERAGADSG